MTYLQFDFDIDSAEQSNKLVALLAIQGFDGFEEQENKLVAFIAEDRFNEPEFATVIDRFEAISYTQSVIENINWNKKWEEDFKPVLVENFVGIRASFHEPIHDVEHEIIITPKMSFGTGHHATTYLVMNQMKELVFLKKRVLDFGTGTGVLAILASKLGAEKVLAIDYDEWSITNAKENIVQNNCANISVVQADHIDLNEKFDIVLANINLNVIVSNMPAISAVAISGGVILLSGFLKENEKVIITSLKAAGLQYQATRQRGDWLIIMANKPLTAK